MKSEPNTLLAPPEIQMTVMEASRWASHATGRKVTSGNIQYLVNYGRIRNVGGNGKILIPVSDLQQYYEEHATTEHKFKSQLGDDLNWALSFDEYKEYERTKHVHRLHPYKGKFIPQLVEYFLDDHIDDYKTDVWFRPGDVVLDPFCGSGTTLVQANELGIHAIGVDISEFNAWISNVKLSSFDIDVIYSAGAEISDRLNEYVANSPEQCLDLEFSTWLSGFNQAHFPSAEFKRKVRQGVINEKSYVAERSPEVVFKYSDLVNRLGVDVVPLSDGSFLDRWYLPPVRRQIERVKGIIDVCSNDRVKQALQIILSRTARTCRATTHADLATLQVPVWSPYYCKKHGKFCKPLLSISGWWARYLKDTVKRLREFDSLRTDTLQHCLTGDARSLDIGTALRDAAPGLSDVARAGEVRGIFSSPPYVGLIDYHEQHAYAYELLGFERRDRMEIGKLSDGQSKAAKEAYVAGVSDVLINCQSVLADDCDIFLVANDKHDLFSTIAERASLDIIDTFRRPVLNRTEKDRSSYAETIFHMKIAR